VGEKLTTSGYFGSGQTWTLPDAYNITLDVYPPYQRYRRVYPPNRWRADRTSSAATNHALQLGATDLEYEGTRVKSPVLGRDLNPLGRGDGVYYCNGGNAVGRKFFIDEAKPWFSLPERQGFGNSMNNCGPGGNCSIGGAAGPGAGAGAGGGTGEEGGAGDGGGVGSGGGGGGIGGEGGEPRCHVLYNGMYWRDCPLVGAGCIWTTCKDPGSPEYVYSCFNRCTYGECKQLQELVWDAGDVFCWCTWQGGVAQDYPPIVALFTQSLSEGPGSPLADCLSSGLCLDECIDKAGGKVCTGDPCDVPPEPPTPSIISPTCTSSQRRRLEDSLKRICLHLGLTLPEGCEHECLSDYEFKQCLRDICAGKRSVRFKCLTDDNWYCKLFGHNQPAFTWWWRIWLCPDFFRPIDYVFDSRLFHELLHWCEPGIEWEPPWGGGPVERRQEKCYPGTT